MMTAPTGKLNGFALALLGTACVASPALAQQPGTAPTQTDVQAQESQPAAPAADSNLPSSDPTELKAANRQALNQGDIVVTARRVSESLQSVPVSITAIGAARLEANRTFTPESLDGAVPSVKVFKNVGTSNGYAVFIRGIGRDNGAWNVEAPVAFYVDDVYYGFQVGPVIDIGGIERVEVLRGPQGTLYGRNATVGAVKYISTRPDLDEVKGRANLTVGSYKRFETNGGISVPLVPGELAVKLDAGYRYYDGFMYDVGDKTRRNGDNTFSTKGSLLWNPSDNFELFVTADYMRARNEIAINTPFITTGSTVTPVYGSVYRGAHGGPGNNKVDSAGVTANAKLDVGDVTLKSITSYRGFRFFYLLDNTGGQLANANQASNAKDRTFTQELQASGQLFDDRLTYVTGLFYLRSNTHGYSSRLNSLVLTDQLSKSYSAYVDLTLRITEQLGLSAGVRYTKDEKDSTQDARRLTAAGTFRSSGSQSWKATTPRVSVDYKITPDILAYASYSKGFKVGQLNTLEPATLAAANVFIPPEKATSKEIGLKTTLFDRALTLNVDYFWTDYKNQASAFLVGQVSFLAVADAKLKGLEVEANLRPVRNWVISGTLTTLNGKYVNVAPQHPAFAFADRTLKHAPDITYRIGSHYTIENVGPGNLTFGGDLNYVDDTWISIVKSPVAFQKAWYVLNADIGYSFGDGKYEVSIAGSNITSSKYSKVAAVPFSRWYSAPDEYSLTFKAKF